MMDDELYEALDAARRTAAQPAALSLSPQAQARMAQATGAVAATAGEDLRADGRTAPQQRSAELAAVSHVDVRA